MIIVQRQNAFSFIPSSHTEHKRTECPFHHFAKQDAGAHSRLAVGILRKEQFPDSKVRRSLTIVDL